jgi:hypothetical protein
MQNSKFFILYGNANTCCFVSNVAEESDIWKTSIVWANIVEIVLV